MAIKPGIMNIGGGNTAPSSDETKKREEEKISEEEREAARRIVEGYYRNTVSSDNRGFTQDYANAVERAGAYGAGWTNENAPTDDISRAQENASGLARNTELYSGAVDKAFGSGVSGGLYDTYTDASKNLSDIRTGVRAQRDLYNQYENADDYNADQRLFSMSSDELKKESDKIRQTLDETKKNAYKGILGFGYIKDADGRYRLYTPDSPMDVTDSIKSMEDQLMKLDALYNSKKYSEDVSKYGIDPASMTYDQLMDTMRVGSDAEKRFALDYYNSLGQSNLQTKRAVEWYTSLPKDEKAKLDGIWENAQNSALVVIDRLRVGTYNATNFFKQQESDQIKTNAMRSELLKNGYSEEDADRIADLYSRRYNASQNAIEQARAKVRGDLHPVASQVSDAIGKVRNSVYNLGMPLSMWLGEYISGKPVDVNNAVLRQDRAYETARNAAMNSSGWNSVESKAKGLFGDEAGARVTGWMKSAVSSGLDDLARNSTVGTVAKVLGAEADVISKLVSVIASSDAALTEFRQNVESGKNTDEAFSRAALTGFIEFLTEMVGGEFVWDNILRTDSKGLMKIVTTVAKNMLAEGTEEVMGNALQRALNGLTADNLKATFESIKNGNGVVKSFFDNTGWRQDVKAYMDQGLSLDSAMTRALGDWISEDVDAFMSAFLSAGLSSGGTMVITRALTNSSKKVIGDMVNSLTHDSLLKMVRNVEAKLKSGASDGKPYTKEAAADDVERVRGALVNARENIAQTMTGEESTAEDRAFAEKEAEKINRAIGQVEELSSAIRNDRTEDIPQVAASIEASIREETEREAEEARTKSKRERAISDFVRGLVYGGTRMAQIDQDLTAEIRRLDADAKSGVEGAQKKLDFANEALAYLRRYAGKEVERDGLKAIGKSLDLLGHGKDRSVTIQYDFTWNDDQRNASYDRATNTVTLNPYSPMTQNHVRFVLGHELLHALRADGERGQAIVDSAWNTIQSLMESGQIRRDDENYNMDVLSKLYAGDVRSYLNGEEGRAEVASYVKQGMTEEAARAKATEQYLKEEAVANFFGDASFWGLDKNGNPIDRRTLMWSENDTERQRREKAKQLKNLSPLFDVNAVLSDMTQSKARRVLSDFVRTIRNFARSIVGAKPVEAKRFDTLADAYEAVLKRFDAKPVNNTANTENASEAAQGAATEGVERNSRSVAVETPSRNYNIPDNYAAFVRNTKAGFADKLVDGEKTVETRPSRTLDKFIGKWMPVLKTESGEVIGRVFVDDVIKYDDKDDFDADYGRHLVPESGNTYSWDGNGERYGYVIAGHERFDEPVKLDEYAKKYGRIAKEMTPTVVLSDNGQVAAVDDVAVASNMADLITEDPRPADYDDQERHSITTKDQWEKSYLNAGGESVVAEQMDRLTEAMIANNLIYGYVPTGDYDYSDRGPLRDNVEYGVSFDLDASCPRTFQFLFYRNKLQRIAGRPLTYNESMQLIELMKAYGQNIPCSYCYVETKRILQASNFLNWFKYHTDVLTAETDAEAKRRMYSYNAKKGTLSKAAQEVFDEWRSGDRSYTPSAQDVWFAAQTARNSVMNYLDGKLKSGEITADAPKTDMNRDVLDRFGVTDEKATSEIGEYVDQWLYDTKAKVPHLYSVFNNEDASEVDERALSMYRTAMNYAKSASSARGVDNYVPYTDQLRNIPAELKQKILAMGGLRKHSSNDFRMDYVHDYFLLFADMALGGWTGHTYTKNTDYVKIFGRTGDRINMSVAFEERGGRIYENVQEGMNWRDARQLRNDYYDNAGVMAMVTSNRQLSYALNADWIDMIIPFHASGMAKAVWYNMKAWSDFTSKQNERFKTKAQMTAELKNKGVKVPSKANAAEVREMYDREMEIVKIYDKDGKRVVPHILPGDYVFNGQTIEGHRNDPEAYLRLCQKYGVRPRFQGIKVDDGNGHEIDVTEHPNYFRLIKETARTETEQKPIQFNFDEKDDALGMTPFEYAMDRMEQEAKIGGFGNLAEDKYGIVRKFVDNFLGKNKPLPRVLDDKGNQTKQSMYDMLPEEAKEFLDYLWEKQKDVNGQQYEVVEDSVNEVSERSSRSAVSAEEANERYSRTVNFGTYFSGGGLVDYALRDVTNSVMAVEKDEKAAEVFMLNNGEVYNGDVIDFSRDRLDDLVGKVEYFHASPVCKNYSRMNTRRTLKSDSKLDIMTAQATADAIDKLRPPVFTLEQVPGYLGSEAYTIVADKLTELGYKWDYTIADAHDYGGATSRERLMLRAVKDKELPPKPKKTNGVSWYEATLDLFDEFPAVDHVASFMQERIDRTPSLKNALKAAKEPILVLGGTPGGKAWWSSASDPCPSITTDMSDARIFMPDGRVLKATPRFFARIMGLPDTYKFTQWNGKDNATQAYKVIGNGVPVQLTQSFFGNLLNDTLDTGVRYGERSSRSVAPEENDRYMELAKDPVKNADALQGMVEKAAEQAMPETFVRDNNGNIMPVYHGTASDFTVFKPQARYTGMHPYYYFSESKQYSEKFNKLWGRFDGSKILKVFLNIENPLALTGGKSSVKQWKAQLQAAGVELDDSYYDDVIEGFGDNVYGWQLFRGDNGTFLSAVKDAGYDGIKTTESSGDTTWVAFKSSQIKSADPVTYYKNGKIIPLSERFNPKEEDIRFSRSLTPEQRKLLDAERRVERLKEDNEFLRRLMESGRKAALSPRSVERIVREVSDLYGLGRDERIRTALGIVDKLYNGKVTGKEREDAIRQLSALSRDMIRDAFYEEDPTREDRERLKAYLKDKTIRVTPELEGDLKGRGEKWGDARNALRGYLNLSRNGSTSIDSIWEEMHDLFPGYFPMDVYNPADMIDRVVEVLDGMEPQAVSVYPEEAVEQNAESLYNALVGKYAKYGDKAFGERLAEGDEAATQRAEARADAEIASAKQSYFRDMGQQELKYLARIHRIEADAARDAKEYSDRIADLESQARAKAMRGSATEMLDAARKNARYIWSAAKNPTGKRFVPQNARGAMERLSNWIDSITVRGGVLNVDGKQPVGAALPSDPVRGDIAVIAKVYGAEYAELAEALLNTIDYYAKYQSDADYQRERNAEKSEWIAESTYKLSQLLRSAVANQNRVWLDGKRRDAETVGGDMIDALNERRGADERFTSVKDKTFGEKAKESASKLLHFWKTNPGLAVTDAYTFLHRIGGRGDEVFDTLRHAQETQTLRNQEFVESMQTKLKGIELSKYGDEKWDKYTVTFNDASGREVTVPRSVAMSVAALWRRMQGREHLENGGFVYDLDGKRSDPIRVGEKSVKSIEDALTDDDKKVMGAMLSFMQDDCTRWGNEATMRRYGFERFTTDNYFRIDVDKFALPANTDKSFSGQPKIENTSFAKPTREGAGAPVVAGDFIRSVIHHVNGMATYSAYLNAEGMVNQILSTKGLRDTMQRVLGNGSVKYVEDLMTALKSQTRNEEDALEKLWSMGAAYYKTAAVAYNLSTALKQPISYTRAAAVMDTKYLTRGMKAVTSSEGRNRALGEMQEFSGTAVKKLNGYSDTGMARDTAMLIGAKKETFRQKIVEFGMRAAEFGDRITWEALWTACREETRDRNPDLTPPELMEATAKRFSSVVAQTQVTNSPLDTAPILRSNSVLTRNLFAFWNEPLKTYNLLMRAYDNIVQAKDGAAAKRALFAAARPVASVAAGMVLEAAVSALFRSLRDDRDDDMDDPETWKKLISLWGGEMVDNAFGVLPYVDQFLEVIRNAMNGYSNTDMGLEVITDILDAAKALADSDGEKAKTEFSRIRALAEAVSTAFGIPAKNVLRTVKTIGSTALNFGGNIKWQYNYRKIFYNPKNATAREKYGFADLLAKAYIEGDEEAYRYIRDDMLQMGLSPASITKSIVKNAAPDDVDGSSSSLTAYKPGSDGWYLAMGAVYDRATGAPRGLEEEVTRLYEATGDSGVLPGFASDSFTVDGKEVKIEGEAYTEFSENYAKRLYEVQTVIRNTAGYRAASDEQKAWWMEKAEAVVGAILKHGIDADYNVTSQGKWIADYLNASDADIAKYIVENTKKSGADSQQTKTRGAEVVNTPKSTEFSQIGYDPSTGTLAVTFRDSGATYTYGGVPESEWNAMQSADSIGKYYNANIKGKYKSEKAG